MASEYFDVIIVGAGMTGISAAKHLQDNCPNKTYALLEGRKAMGGTWDLFRYPGIRSDSDMHTLGYSFKPWKNKNAIAEGSEILNYITDTAEENKIARHIRYQQLVRSANWNSKNANWTLIIDDQCTNKTREIRCGFFLLCSGYYSYEGGYSPDFAGKEKFEGDIVHPQQWPQDLDYFGKKVVVIGSGATAITLVPTMAKTASHVTMLQRTPTYIASKPRVDGIANFLGKILPSQWAYDITRWKNLIIHHKLLKAASETPAGLKEYILSHVREQMGPEYDVDKHFTPDYNPWDQRLCLAPDNDLFKAIKSGSADVVTDSIETFTEKGIKLKSGETIDADIIVTATGLVMMPMGGVKMSKDGEPIDVSDTVSYRGLMLAGVPNTVAITGYFNVPWVLRSEIVAKWVCRVLNHMDRTSTQQVVPLLSKQEEASMIKRPFIEGFSSGYLQRATPGLPKQGDKVPWLNRQDYYKDRKELASYDLNDGALTFTEVSGATSK